MAGAAVTRSIVINAGFSLVEVGVGQVAGGVGASEGSGEVRSASGPGGMVITGESSPRVSAGQGGTSCCW